MQAMPGFAAVLSDQEIGDLATWICATWGGQGTEVTAAESPGSGVDACRSACSQLNAGLLQAMVVDWRLTRHDHAPSVSRGSLGDDLGETEKC